MASFKKLSAISMIPEDSAEEKFLEDLPYESMQQGSMENQFGRGVNAGLLSWTTRRLSLLHSSEKKITYRDFKASNILLDKICDNIGMLKELVIKKDEANNEWDGKMTSQLQDKSTACNLNKYGDNFCPNKRKETVQRVSCNVIAIIVLLWMLFETSTLSSTIQLQLLHKQHGHVFIWSSLLELLGFMVIGWAIAATVAAGPPFSRMQSAMLMFWAILMLVRSAKSITEVYLPILGILFMGWYMLVEKQPPHEG